MATYFRQKLKLPEALGVKVLEIGCNSVYLRWAFLSTHSLTLQQLNALTFELRTTDKSITAECSFVNSKQDIQYEFKARLDGLKCNTKYKFEISSKLQYNNQMIYSEWSSPIQFKTKTNQLTITTNQQHLDIASLKHQLNEYKDKYDELKAQNDELIMKMKTYVPPHHSWDYKKIVEWMMCIQNGILKPYKQTLITNMKQLQIDGKRLSQIDMVDLQRLGITKFTHKKILISHIHKLTENDTPQTIIYRHTSFSNDNDSEDSDFNENGTPRTHFPKQTTHFETPKLTECTTTNSAIRSCDITMAAQTMKASNKVQSNNKLPSLQNNPTSNSYGLTKSVKNLLISTPSDDAPKKWKYNNGVLMVKVIRAENVDNMDEEDGPGSASDPYVEIELNGHYKKEKTKVIRNNANPVWNDKFQLFPENPKEDILKLKLWDKDFWTFDDEIGTVFIPVIDVLNANGYIQKAYDVIGSQCGAKLYLELKYRELQQ